MKILQLNLEKGWRGGERQTLFCMQEFVKAGHEVHLAARQDQALAKRAAEQGIKVHSFAKPYQLLFWLIRYGSQYDIIHSQTAGSLSWAALAKPFLKSKLVYTRRTAFDIKPKKLKRTLMKWRKADVFVSVCEAAAEEPRRLGLDSLIIPSAIQAYKVNTERAQAFQQSLSGIDGKYLVGTTSALTREKDPITMIKAIAILKNKGLPVVFLHFGSFGDMHQACLDKIKALILEEEYRLLGFHEHVEDYVSLLDVFSMSSLSEGVGGSVFDAFWQKVPVASTDAGGLKEVLADGCGKLCPVGDAYALAQAIEEILTQPEQRQIMIDKAHARVQERYFVGPMGQAYLQAYEDVLGQQP